MKTRRPVLYLIILTIGSLVSFLVINHELGDRRFVAEQLRIAMEVLGAFVAITMSIILAYRQRPEYAGQYFLLSMGFFGIGALDAFHALSTPGTDLALLYRSFAIVAGACWFASLWLPGRCMRWISGHKTGLSRAVILGTLSALVLIAATSRDLAMPWEATSTSAVAALRVFAGLLFMAAVVRLTLDYIKLKEPELFRLAIVALLFGLAGLTNHYFSIWTGAWWFWHLLRLSAFSLVLVLIFIDFQKTLGDLRRAVSRSESAAQALERRVSELTTLHHVGKVASSSLDLDKILEIILASAVQVTEARSGFIMLVRPDDGSDPGELELKASLGLPATPAGEAMIDRDAADRVARDGEPLMLEDALYAPITLGDEAIGAVGLVGKVRGGLDEKDLQLLSTLASQASGAIHNARLFADLQESYFSTIHALAAAIEAKDPYTRGHSRRVAAYAEMMARRVGCSSGERRAIKIAAYLHDIGKIGIDERILLKPGGLTAEEYAVIREHPVISSKILAGVPFLKETLPMVTHHHEYFDGTGYPLGLRDKKIPLGARIIAVADAFDAMTSDRPYRRALAADHAILEIESGAGNQFDPAIVKVFLACLQDAPHPALAPSMGYW